MPSAEQNQASPAPLTRWLQAGPALRMNIVAMSAAFLCYFCMYAFRKPFAAGSFEGTINGIELKTCFVISQILGYAISKYLGISILTALNWRLRSRTLLLLITGSWLALLLFATANPYVGAVSLFLNGLCLGMIWGLVVSYLEGRRSSELLLAGLSCAFIVASGVVKDVGRAFLRMGVDEFFMPFVTGAVFIPPLLVAIYFLHHLPAPSAADEAERAPRSSMNGAERRQFLSRFAPAISLLLFSYFLLTAFRDYRDNYGVELFSELGYQKEPALFSLTELPVALGVMGVMALLTLVRSNRLALRLVYLVMILGVLIVSLACWALEEHLISGAVWMILIGFGSYLSYVPFGSVLFDRIIAHTKVAGTAVFGIYLADSVGYTGSVLIQLLSDVLTPSQERLDFFLAFSQLMAWAGVVLMSGSALLLLRMPHNDAATLSRLTKKHI